MDRKSGKISVTVLMGDGTRVVINDKELEDVKLETERWDRNQER